MALLPRAANTEDNNESAASFEAIPAGEYLAQITKSEMKANKAKTGHFLLLIHTVIEGKHKGSSIFVRLNLDNPNPKAVEIANKELNSICQACEQEGVEDSEDLHGIPMCIKVVVEPATAQWSASNAIKKWSVEAEYTSPDEADAPVGFEAEDETVTVGGGKEADLYIEPVQEPKPETEAEPTGDDKLPWE